MSSTLKIELFNKESNKKQEYIAPVITIGHYKKALKLQKEINKDGADEEELLELFLDFIVDIYGGEFTYQQAVDGIDPSDIHELMATHVIRCLGK